jgi:hypothetical protein
MVCFQGACALTNSTNGNEFLENADTSAAKPTEASYVGLGMKSIIRVGHVSGRSGRICIYPLHLAQVPI